MRIHTNAMKGFTLIELMIVVVIVGILAAIAYPTYQSFIKDARRADAKAALMELASAMERYYSENLTYVGTTKSGSNAPAIFADQVPVGGGDAYYNLRITSVSANGYTLQAQPTGPQSGDGTLQLQGTGQRAWDRDGSGGFGSDEKCWEDKCG